MDSEKDNMEQFFQKSLNNYGENPSAGFWSEMEDRIPLPPVAAPSFWKMNGWYISLFLTMGLLFFIGIQKWNNDKTLVDINKTIELQDQTINEISKELTDVQNKFLNKIKTENQKEFQIDAKNRTPQQYIYKYEKEENIPVYSGVEKNNNVITNSKYELLKEEIFEDLLTNKIDLAKNASFNLSPVLTVESISSLFFEAEFSDKNALELPKEETIKFNKIEERGKGIEFFGGFHQAFSGLEIENSILNFDKVINQESNIGLLLSFDLNKKWTFQVGLGFGNIKQTGILKKDFVYANLEQEVSDDVARTKYNVEFKTNYHGLLKFESFLLNYRQNDNQDLYAGDSFLAEISLTKKSKYLYFPVYIKYHVPTKYQKIKWSFKMGFVQRFVYIEHEPTLISLSNFSNSRLEFSHTTNISVTKNLKENYHGELIFGTGVEYLLSEGCTLILEPMYKKNMTLEKSIRSHSFGIFTGVRWNL